MNERQALLALRAFAPPPHESPNRQRGKPRRGNRRYPGLNVST